MRTSSSSIVLVLVLAACGGSGGSGAPDASAGPDGAAVIDAALAIDAPLPIDAPVVVPMTIVISGKATTQELSGTSPVAGLAVAAFRVGDDATPLATATTDAQGNYSLSVTANGASLDAYLRATKAGFVDLYLYPRAALDANFTGANLDMLTMANLGFLHTLAGGGQQAGKGLIGLTVTDAAGAPVAGATVSSTPASGNARYNSGGLPSSTATATDADGVAFLFNVPGAVTVTATKAGMTFHAHLVNARADKFTTTTVAP